MPLAATDGPDLNGLALAAVEAAGAPGFGAIGVSDGSANVLLSGGMACCEATAPAPAPGRRSVWPVCTAYGALMPLTAASSATDRLLERAME